MEIAYYILSLLLIVVSLLPFIPNQHWMFRIWEFARVQVFVLQILVIAIGFIFIQEQNIYFWSTQILLLILFINNIFVLLPYTKFYKTKSIKNVKKDSESISILSVNVYQFNTEFQRLLDLIYEVKPDVILTMESNKAWEDALSVLDKEYPNYKKIALENTYGMHFYTKLKVNRLLVNYFVADDMPSIEVDLETKNKKKFTVFGVHPTPPSPTEEETSKERDGELLSVAKKVKEINAPVLVLGDFNNVAWAKSSILFRKTSELIDPRIGRGLVSTFHAKYKFLRFPIDLFFHSTDIFIEEFKVLRPIGSDHLPLYCRFYINEESSVQESDVEELDKGEISEVNEMIEEGKEEESNRPTVAKE